MGAGKEGYERFSAAACPPAARHRRLSLTCFLCAFLPARRRARCMRASAPAPAGLPAAVVVAPAAPLAVADHGEPDDGAAAADGDGKEGSGSAKLAGVAGSGELAAAGTPAGLLHRYRKPRRHPLIFYGYDLLLPVLVRSCCCLDMLLVFLQGCRVGRAPVSGGQQQGPGPATPRALLTPSRPRRCRPPPLPARRCSPWAASSRSPPWSCSSSPRAQSEHASLQTQRRHFSRQLYPAPCLSIPSAAAAHPAAHLELRLPLISNPPHAPQLCCCYVWHFHSKPRYACSHSAPTVVFPPPFSHTTVLFFDHSVDQC